MGRYPRTAQYYIRVVTALGVVAIIVAACWPGAWDRLWITALGGMLSLLASLGKVPVTGDVKGKRADTASHISLGFVPAFLMLIFQGPLAAMVVATVNIAITSMYPRKSFLHQVFFSIAAVNLAILSAAAILAPFDMAPRPDLSKPTLPIGTANHDYFYPYIGVTVATGVYFLVNSGLVAGVIALCSQQNIWKVWKEGFAWGWLSYYAGGACAVLVALLVPFLSTMPIATAAISLVAFPIPLLMLLLHRYHWQNRIKQEEYIEQLQRNQEALERANSELQRSQDQLRTLFRSTVESLALAIEAKDRYTREHIQRVSLLAEGIGREMGLTPEQLIGLETAALLHDIGKIAVPEQILTKPGRLTDEEMERIKTHPEMGARILEPVNFPYEVLPAVRSHHERWDGTGYPEGLAGEKIPLGGRILAVADVFDALTTPRPYRAGWSEDDALDYIRKNSGSHFDPAVVQAFLAILEKSPRLHLLGEGRQTESPVAPDAVMDGITRASFEYLSLYEISQTISTTLNLGDTLSLLTVKIRGIFNASTCLLTLRDEEGRLRVERATGLSETDFPAQGGLWNDGLSESVVRTGEGFSGSVGEGRAIGLPAPLRSTLIAPLVADGESLGTVNLYHERGDAFDPEDLQVLRAVAAQAARAIRNAREYDRTFKSAYSDSLTGLANARYLMHLLERDVDRARVEQRPLTVLVLDLDDFKPINDRYGHIKGNLVLRDLGGVLHSALRAGDVVARYAGDEFVVVLPDASSTDAENVIEKLRSAVAAYDPSTDDPDLEGLRLSISIGSASFPSDGIDATGLIASADRSMYLDKSRKKGGTLTTARRPPAETQK